MKIILLFWLLIFQYGNLTFAQKASFNIQYSEELAVYMFLKNLSPKYGENPFKREFQKSGYNEKKYLDLILQFDALKTDYSYPFSAFPYGVKIPMITESILKNHLIEAVSLQDFKTRSVGLIPMDDLIQLTNILAEFTPIYNELIYIPNQSSFESQLKILSKLVNTHNLSQYFEKGLQFYRSVWDSTVPFEMVFYPLPNSQGFTAEAFNNNSVSAIPVGFEDNEMLLSVMMHEIFHILYDEQSLHIKKIIDTYFRQSPSACSQYAALLLNEVLATAAGNGYVYEQLTGKQDAEDWYFFSYINLMAKKIYPTVQTYLKENRAIDKAFIDTYIQLYEQHFMHWLNEPDHIFTYRYVLSSNPNDFDTISRLFPYCSAMETREKIDLSSLEELKNTPITKIIIVSKDHTRQLALIKNSFPSLKKWQYDSQKEFTYRVFLDDNTQLFIINQYRTETETFFQSLNLKTTNN